MVRSFRKSGWDQNGTSSSRCATTKHAVRATIRRSQARSSNEPGAGSIPIRLKHGGNGQELRKKVGLPRSTVLTEAVEAMIVALRNHMLSRYISREVREAKALAFLSFQASLRTTSARSVRPSPLTHPARSKRYHSDQGSQ